MVKAIGSLQPPCCRVADSNPSQDIYSCVSLKIVLTFLYCYICPLIVCIKCFTLVVGEINYKGRCYNNKEKHFLPLNISSSGIFRQHSCDTWSYKIINTVKIVIVTFILHRKISVMITVLFIPTTWAYNSRKLERYYQTKEKKNYFNISPNKLYTKYEMESLNMESCNLVWTTVYLNITVVKKIYWKIYLVEK